MMATISTLAVNLIARTSVFERGMRRSRGSMKRFKAETVSTTTRLASFAKGLLVSGGAVFAIKTFTEAASRAQETMNLFNTVFAENATETAKWADSFATNIGRSKTEVREWAATLQDTFVPLGFARDRAAELSKSLVELAVDVGSFKNTATDLEVIDAFTSAIVGNHRAVRRFGIVLTEGSIKMEALRSGINKSFSDLTELEKVQLRYNLILKGTSDAQGDAIKTASNYANRVKKLKGQLVDLKEQIGNDLIPTMTNFVSITSSKVIPVLRFLSSALGRHILTIAKVATQAFLLTKAFKAVAIAIGWVKLALKKANIEYGIMIAQRIILMALKGPAAWAATAAAIAVAAAAVVGINIGLKETVANMAKIGDEAVVMAKNVTTSTPDIKISGLDRAGLAAERLNVLKQISTEQSRIAFWGDKWGEDITGNEKRLKELEVRLRAIGRESKKLAQAEDLKKGLEIDAKSLGDLDKFIANIDKQIKVIELGSLEAQFDDFLIMAENLETLEFAPLFVQGIRDAESAMNRLIEVSEEKRRQEEIKNKQESAFKDLAAEANALKESLKGPEEKLNDIRERYAEMLAMSLITSDQFDKGLAKARESLSSGTQDPGFGRFSEIRSEFIDVAALNGRDRQTEQQEANQLSKEQIRILRQIANDNRVRPVS